MKMPKKELIIIFAGVFLVAWVFGVLRFEHQWANVMFNVLLFPFGLLYISYESYCTLHLASSHLLNNELIQIVFFLLSIVSQIILFYYVFIKIKIIFKLRVS